MMNSNYLSEYSIEYIDEILCQCAEECNELSQACLKMRRVLHNTTHVSYEHACDNLNEELGDVLNCINTILDHRIAEVDTVTQAQKLAGFNIRLQKIQIAETSVDE